MTPKLVTLDAAGTLVRVRWSPVILAEECIERLELSVDKYSSAHLFGGMLRRRWSEYMAVNQQRSFEAGDLFWRHLCADWLIELGLPSSRLDDLTATVWDLLYGPTQTYFSLFEDVLPALDKLKETGVHLVVISNWDYSLHRILKMIGIYDRFDLVIASLEEGFEKPDPRIFHLALDRFAVEAKDALHIGDDATDDHSGAKGVGMRSLLIDRSRGEVEAPFISSLMEIVESTAWTN